jgi:large subunit ribosomal protein L25
MAEIKLNAEKRAANGKGAARRIRAEGKVPAILYGKDLDPIPVAVDRRELFGAFHTDAGMNVLLDLDVGGKKILAIARELQRDPVKGTVLHADFIRVSRTQQVEVEVPITLVGEAPGAKEGGVLEQPLFAVHLKCLVTEVPEHIDADISSLQIGDVLRVGDLALGDFEMLTDPGTVVVSVAAPISEEQLAAMEAEVAGPVEEPEEVVPEEEAALEAAEGAAQPVAEGEEPPTEGDEKTEG